MIPNYENNLMKQKEFSRLTTLSRKALAIYERRELLVPHQIDTSNGYRYYSAQELETALRIAFLRNLDLSLEKIAEIIQNKIPFENFLNDSGIRRMLNFKLNQTINALDALNLCTSNPALFNHQIRFRNCEPMGALTLEGSGNAASILTTFNQLINTFKKLHFIQKGSLFTKYFNDSTPQKLHYKCGIPISEFSPLVIHDIKTEILPNCKLAALTHFGTYELLPAKYAKLTSEVKARNWNLTGEFIEIYIIGGNRFSSDASSYITEIGAVVK